MCICFACLSKLVLQIVNFLRPVSVCVCVISFISLALPTVYVQLLLPWWKYSPETTLQLALPPRRGLSLSLALPHTDAEILDHSQETFELPNLQFTLSSLPRSMCFSPFVSLALSQKWSSAWLFLESHPACHPWSSSLVSMWTGH